MRTFQPRSLDAEGSPPPDQGFRETVRWVIAQAEALAAGMTSVKGLHGALVYSVTRDELRRGATPDEIRLQRRVIARVTLSAADLSWLQQEELEATIRETSEAAIEGRPPAPEYLSPASSARRIDRLWPLPL